MIGGVGEKIVGAWENEKTTSNDIRGRFSSFENSRKVVHSKTAVETSIPSLLELLARPTSSAKTARRAKTEIFIFSN